MPRTGVLFLNLGGPETLADVKPFLYNLFADPEIIRLPFTWMQKPLAWFISTMRSQKSAKNYARIGGGSPLRKLTEEQANALRDRLAADGYDVSVYIAMRYWNPFTEETVRQLVTDGIERVAILPLYPQYSISTTGSSLKLLDELWANDPQLAKIERFSINSWYDQPRYLDTMARYIARELDALDEPDKAHVLFSAHGIPESYVTSAGDPYQKEMEACVKLIWKHLDRPNDYTLSYQSRVGPVKWLSPYTEDVLPQLAARGVRDLVVVPISFISEHIETLDEIDREYRELALEAGMRTFRRVPCLNSDPDFIAALADMVTPYLGDADKQSAEPELSSIA
ncbi:ferrochelatase [Synechococcus sp. PCC 7336]|uniref:ferrochelatase n=1 Tax=Synechococcus sp. PCC 7336 TaxID=195250 RepID=UPI00035DD315